MFAGNIAVAQAYISEKECKTGAIAFFLGADIGGMGSEMTVNESKDTILWKIKKYTGEEQTIEINKKDSNKY